MAQWKQILSHNYSVSDLGEIRNDKTGRIMKTYSDRDGYQRVILSKGNRPFHYVVHRLVAIAFIQNPGNKLEVNHIDADKLNNSAENLEWASNRENIYHAHRNGLMVKKLNHLDILRIEDMYSTNQFTYGQIAKEFNVSNQAVRYYVVRYYKHVTKENH